MLNFIWNMSDSEDFDENELTNFEVSEIPTQEELIPLLECPVCFDLPLPPIRVCSQGHILCDSCCIKLKKCPLCQKPIGNGRNFFAEDFISKSKILCKFRRDGCQILTTGANIKQHLHNCNFRPIKCPNCTRRISYKSLEEHLFKDHHISRWEIDDEGLNVVQTEKNRRNGEFGVDHCIPRMDLISSNTLFKSLIALSALSIVTDHLFSYIEHIPN